jgi:hypothetical protein
MSRAPYPLVFAALSAIVVFVTWPQALVLGTGVNDFGDPLLNAWTLAWVAHALATGPSGLFDANIFHPEAGVLAFSEPLIVPGLLLAPLQWLGADPILAHNLLLLAGYTLSGVAVFALVRSLTGSDAAAFVAAVAFAALPYRTEYYAKVQLQLAMWIPLALWRLHALVDRGRLRDGVLAGAFMALQAYTCIYYVIYGGVFVAMAGVVAVWGASVPHRAAVGRGLVAGALLFAVTSAPLALALRSASNVVGERGVDEVRARSARLDDYRRPHPDNRLYGRDDRPGIGERRLFPGYALPILAAAGAAGGGLVAGAYVVATAGAVVLSLGANGPGYPWLFDHLEPFRALRVPARFAMLAGLGMAVLGGLGIARLTRRASPRARAAIAAIAVVVLVAEGRNRTLDLSELPEPAPLVYRWLGAQRPGVVVEYPLGDLEGRAGPQDATYQYYSTRHWQRLVNGYSGFAPASYLETRAALASFPEPASLAHLAGIGADYLLVHSRFYITGDFDADVAALRRERRVTWIGSFRWLDGEVTEVFRIVR